MGVVEINLLAWFVQSALKGYFYGILYAEIYVGLD